MSAQSPLVLIMAAGMGTRMKSERAKVLHEVAGRSMIGWVVTAAHAAGAQRVVAIVGHKSETVKADLDARFGDGTIDIAIQAEQLGTGHAVQCALPTIARESDDRIVVILTGDAPLILSERIAQLTAACAASPSGMALLSTIPDREMPYGRVVRDAAGKLLRIVEHVDATAEERQIKDTNAGFYAVKLGHLRKDLETLKANNAKGELYLTDLVACAALRGGATAIDTPFTEVAGVNDRVDLATLDAAARKRINENWMRAGVTMVDPERTFIDADVGPIGRDVWIGPGVCLRGKTSIASNAYIDTGCVITASDIDDGAYVKPYTIISESKIGPRTHLGPFTHCRPGTQVDEGAHLGNFVETKKTHMMAGAKANHLAYLGDASVGAKANIGAGTITCNYDGFNKHQTTIESGAFIGSDSQLIAPVTIGRDAYVGSGTTVDKDVPRGALAISRVKQVIVEGWAERFREKNAKKPKSGG
jgi:bifunctional UDP-N-acetylglucosamine pyrophosphorylase / glucosamine-1-phosphate N-acetyltransferase